MILFTSSYGGTGVYDDYDWFQKAPTGPETENISHTYGIYWIVFIPCGAASFQVCNTLQPVCAPHNLFES